MNSIPTKYKHRLFRSRLEARWACMFDKLGWKWEYEPVDLPGWSPDFLIKGKTDLLVEVKPITELDEEVAKKMVKAAPERELLILGCTFPLSCINDWMVVGWLREWPWPNTCLEMDCRACKDNPNKPNNILRRHCERLKTGFWGKAILGRTPPNRTYGINGTGYKEDYITGKFDKQFFEHFYGEESHKLFKPELNKFWQESGNEVRF